MVPLISLARLRMFILPYQYYMIQWGGGHHCSLIVIDLLLSYLKKVRGVGRNAGGEDRKTLTQRRFGGGGFQFHCQGASLRFMHPHVSWDIIHASTGKY